MDSESVKILILEKIIDVFAPKIIGYYNILNNSETQTWTPNLYYIQEHHRENDSKDSININFSIDKTSDIVSINFTKIKYHETPHIRRLERLAGIAVEPRPEPEIIEFKFRNKQTAIKEICKHTDVNYLTKIGMAAIVEIENHENLENMSIGAIKKILDIKPGLNLNDLEIRKVLLEITK